MANAYRDENSVPTLIAASNSDGKTPVRLYADPTTHRLLTDTAGGSGTVTEVDTGTGLTGGPITTTGTIALDSKLAPLDTLGSAGQSVRVNAGATALEYYTPSGGGSVTTVSVVSANGLAGTVANATTTPAITLSTSITGILKGNGTAISAASAGTDYVTASSTNTFTNKTFDTAGTGNVFDINGTAITAVTGTGAVVLATSPTLITPVLGVATATSINKVAITAPATSATITIADGKTLTVSNSLTLAGTDSTVMTFPGTSQTVAGLTSTQTFTNKRITRRLTTTNAPGATPSTNTDNVDIQAFTGLATAITSMTSSLSGTPVDGDLLEFRFTDNGTARAITWGTSFESTTVTLPTTTVISTMLRVGFEWNATASKWDCIATC